MKKIVWSQHGRRLISLSKAPGTAIVQLLARAVVFKLTLVGITNELHNK